MTDRRQLGESTDSARGTNFHWKSTLLFALPPFLSSFHEQFEAEDEVGLVRKRTFLISPHFLSFSFCVVRRRNVAVPGISGQLRGKSTTKLESLHLRRTDRLGGVFPGKKSLPLARTPARKFKLCHGIVAIVNPRVTVFFRERSRRSSVKAHSSVREGGEARYSAGPPILNQNEAIYPSDGSRTD